MNPKERQVSLINNDKNLSLKGKERKEIFDKAAKERFEEITELTNETNFDDLIYYYKNMSRRR